jgi:hypothetical protein
MFVLPESASSHTAGPSMSEPPLFALVLMPFDPKFDDVYLIGIQEAAAAMGFRAERLDSQLFREGMMERLYQQIDRADLIIADMSTRNPNVFYEVGYADARDKLCILITADAADIPFNLKHRRHIVYGTSLDLLRRKLKDDLAWAAGEIQAASRSPIRAVPRPMYGIVTETEPFIKGSVEFEVDLFNDSDRHVVEVYATYLYVVDQSWRFVHDKRSCGTIDSNLEQFGSCHLISSQVSRIPRTNGIPLRFTGTLVIASGLDERRVSAKESVSLKEPALLRIITERGNVDIELEIDPTFIIPGSD